MSQEMGKELGWDDEIVNDGPEFVLLPEGDYNFTVKKFERARFQGSANMPPCNQAKLEITIHSQEHGDQTVFHNLFLHTKTEGFLSAFFTGIGQKKKGEPLRMNWNAVVGAKGRCKLEHNTYTNNEGKERTNNQIDRIYPYEDYLKHAGGNQPSGNTGQFNQQQNQSAPQQQQQAPQGNTFTQQQNQAPFPTNNQQQNQQQQQGEFVPGKF